MHRNIIIIAVAATVAFLAVLLIPRMLADASEDDDTEVAARESEERDAPARGGNDLEADIETLAERVNDAGPVRIDEVTMMTSAIAAGNRIRYRYEISRPLTPTQVTAFEERIAEQNRQNVCTRPSDREIIDRGGEIEYVYFGVGNAYLFSTSITDC